MSDQRRPPPDSEGFGLDDLPLVNRALFDHAVRAATDLHDPALEPDAFVEALWGQLANVFEWLPPSRQIDVTPPAPYPMGSSASSLHRR